MRSALFPLIFICGYCNSLELERGMAIPTDAVATGRLILINASSLKPEYELVREGIAYRIGVSHGNYNDKKVINYISTNDTKFKTPEGISVSLTYQELTEKGYRDIKKMNGWAQWARLPSGWSAAFCEGKRCTDVKVQLDSKVKWLFK